MIVGAPKCGTTSLALWLGSQPYAVLASRKETGYFTDLTASVWAGPGADFTDSFPRSAEAFEAEFAAKPDAPLRIEATTDSMSCPLAAENIARFAERPDVADVRIVALVRDPVARIVSEYEHTLRMGWQSGSLMDSLQAEAKRKADGWHPLFRHIERTRYATQIARFSELFGDRVLTLDAHRIGEVGERTRLMNWMGRKDETDSGEMENLNKRKVAAHSRGVALLRNKALISGARAVVPKGLRPVIRRMVIGAPVARYQPDAAETDFIYNALANEISACLDAPDIPTESWNVSRLMPA